MEDDVDVLSVNLLDCDGFCDTTLIVESSMPVPGNRIGLSIILKLTRL